MARPKEVLHINKIQICSLNLRMKVRQQAGCMWHQKFWLPCTAAKCLLNMAYCIYPLSVTNGASLRSMEGSPKRALHLCFSMAGICEKAGDCILPLPCPSAMTVFRNAAGFGNPCPL